ncbi:MAG: phospho-sugar mutase [Verrucomicrobia bacterium]|nr:phospho-sugar mutase [Verrucomicrobiota bacterium]
MSTEFKQAIESAVQEEKLSTDSAENVGRLMRESKQVPRMVACIQELVDTCEWEELNDRFFRTLAFGTGGLRGRTIGKVVTKAEMGKPTALGRPEFPAVGTNCMNEGNVVRATQGLVNYLQKSFPGQAPRVVFAHDTRFFSREFAELAARTVAAAGGTAYLFSEDRSTPELSFAVRHLGAQAGVEITASHNPSHDNGYKAYFSDGAQIVEPHASGIIREVEAVREPNLNPQWEGGGKVVSIGAEVDEEYQLGLRELILEEEMLKKEGKALKVVFSPLHGTGGRIVPEMLARAGVKVLLVKEQEKGDGRFPTVKSPNPENGEALAMGIELAKKERGDLVLATDPDGDRMGVALRNRDGEYELITGNQIGSLLAAYRIDRMRAKGWIQPGQEKSCCLIKTFVTTDLQKEIAAVAGIRCVETLTGFKYIGEKLGIYEKQAGGRGKMGAEEWRKKRMEKSTFFVFGGEESYGYSGGDFVRDKDANGAVLMFVEAAAWAKSQGRNLLEEMDEIYRRHGLYLEKLGTLEMPGAEGAKQIAQAVESYQSRPPKVWGGRKVVGVIDFEKGCHRDVEGQEIPKERMLIFDLGEGFRVAVRASGTEPKMKCYFFGKRKVGATEDLGRAKQELAGELNELWSWTQADAKKRAQGEVR